MTHFVEQYKETITLTEVPGSVVEYIFDAALKNKLTELFVSIEKRVDDRSFDQIRQISVEVGILPFTHGSALFTRGRNTSSCYYYLRWWSR